jgi:hypothetical protein
MAAVFSLSMLNVRVFPFIFLIAKKGLVVLLFRSTGVKNRLRVIFIIDCAQPTYETVLETHPSMYKYSDAIWMENWTKISMTAVAARILK